MRDLTIVNELNNIKRAIGTVHQSLKLGITSEAIRAQALYNLLIEKKIITAEEMEKAVGDVIKEANAAQAAPESTIVAPTADQVATIEKTVQ